MLKFLIYIKSTPRKNIYFLLYGLVQIYYLFSPVG